MDDNLSRPGRNWATMIHTWQERPWLPGLAALGLLLLVYTGTLQWDINGSSNGYMIDVGEIQVALNVWGTIHHTGYPLFTILGALLTWAGQITGMSPAASASAVAMVWSLLGLAIIYRVLWRLTQGERGIAALIILNIGLVETFWIHSVVAEVYSFSLFLMSLTLLVTLRLVERWNRREWLIMTALLGTGAAHHRLLVMLIPCALIPIAPTLYKHRSRWSLWILSALAFLIPFLAYLYLPLRALQNSFWVYGRPGDWSGFWSQFSGREETSGLLRIPRDYQQWLTNLHFLAEQLEHQLPLVALLAGGIGLIWLTRRHPWTGMAWLSTTLAFMAFVLTFPEAVWAPATLMPCLLLLALGGAYLLYRLIKQWTPARWIAWIGLSLLLFTLFKTNLPFVWSLVHEPLGKDVIQTLYPLKKSNIPGGHNVVALPWGGSFFAAAYGLHVTKELGGFELVDHRADFRSIVDTEGKIITLAFNLGNWPLYWWSDLLGEAHYSTAAPDIAVISRNILYKDVPPQINFDLGNGVRIRAVDIVREDEDKLQVTIYWEKAHTVQSDYRVAIHLVSKDPPQDAQDVLAQADSFNPVSGWYPVTLWEIGEIVRDDYALSIPPGTWPAAMRIGMYQIDQDGNFINTQWLSLEIP